MRGFAEPMSSTSNKSSLLETRRKGAPSSAYDKRGLPDVSLVVVVRNEKHVVTSAVDSLVGQKYPRELLEIIRVDGLSEDGTAEILAQTFESLERRGWRVSLFENPRHILATGWNIAVRASLGDLMCRIDAHSELYPDYVRRGVEVLQHTEDTRIGAVGGVLEHYGRGLIGEAVADLLASRFSVGNSPFRTDKDKRARLEKCRETDTAVYALYPKRIFEEIGYFDEGLARNQDIEFHERVKAKGYRFLTCPDMRIKYHVRNTVRALVKKAHSDGYWTAFLRKASLRHRIPAFFALYLIFYGLLCAASWGLRGATTASLVLCGLPLILYLLMTGFYALKDGRGVTRLLLCGLFPLYHLSYGLGTLKGMAVRGIRPGTPPMSRNAPW